MDSIVPAEHSLPLTTLGTHFRATQLFVKVKDNIGNSGSHEVLLVELAIRNRSAISGALLHSSVSEAPASLRESATSSCRFSDSTV